MTTVEACGVKDIQTDLNMRELELTCKWKSSTGLWQPTEEEDYVRYQQNSLQDGTSMIPGTERRRQ